MFISAYTGFHAKRFLEFNGGVIVDHHKMQWKLMTPWPSKCRENELTPFQVNVQYDFVTNMNDQSACCVLLNVCDLEQELWSK